MSDMNASVILAVHQQQWAVVSGSIRRRAGFFQRPAARRQHNPRREPGQGGGDRIGNVHLRHRERMANHSNQIGGR
jgi:hypothetical protein